MINYRSPSRGGIPQEGGSLDGLKVSSFLKRIFRVPRAMERHSVAPNVAATSLPSATPTYRTPLPPYLRKLRRPTNGVPSSRGYRLRRDCELDTPSFLSSSLCPSPSLSALRVNETCYVPEKKLLPPSADRWARNFSREARN